MSNMVRRDQGGYGHRPQPPPQGGFYYSSRGGSAAPSPSQHSYRSDPPSHMATPHQGGARGMDHRGAVEGRFESRSVGVDPRINEQTPSYFVEHLATFAVGRQFGLVQPTDGIRKLKQLERSSAIWAQPMILRLRPNSVSVEDENGDLVEQFPMELVEQPTAHVSSDARDAYNNILLFVVMEDSKGRRSGTTPTEMHIFQCNRVSAKDVADDLQHYIRGQFKRVRNGRRSGPAAQPIFPQYQQDMKVAGFNGQFSDDVSVSSETSEMFERDVNTLNRCFDDIERFVARTQSAALAQRELEAQAHRYRTAQRRDKRVPPPDPNGILQMRAQLPLEAEFVDVLKKFKLSFNLLAKLRNHIHEPNAPELVHFLFTPLNVILEASHWGLGRNIAPQVVSPLLSLEARELMQNCLNSKEMDTWMSLGESWRTPPEDWQGPLPPPFRPVFIDGFAPYGPPEPRSSQQQTATIHRGQSEPPVQYRPRERERSVDTAPSTPASERYVSQHRRLPQRNMSVDNLNIGRLSLEKEKIDFEKEKIRERQRRLEDEERRIKQERERLKAEQALIVEERKRNLSTSNSNLDNTRDRDGGYRIGSMQPSPQIERRTVDAALPMALPHDPEQSPRQRAFVQDVVNRRCKLVQATYDRVAQNQKELTVTRGEFLEVLNDSKNWWECKNMHNRVGYVPHTILSVVPHDGRSVVPLEEDIYVPSTGQTRMPLHSPIHNGNGHLSNGNISPGQSREIYVHNAGVQANIHQITREPKPEIPVAPPIPSMAQQIERTVLKPVAAQPEASKLKLQNPRMVINKRPPLEAEMLDELVETLGRKEGNKMAPPKRPPRSSVHLTEQTSPDEVQTWLREKGFSVRLFDLLEGQDGAALFSLSRFALERAAGKDEGSRLYSQILVEKSLSNYQTKSAAELKAILNFRRKHVELSNEAASDEPLSQPQLTIPQH